jgi:GNAT superfamily N-acetyltransferase
MCGPGFATRAADEGDLPGIAGVAAEAGVAAPDAAELLALARDGRGQLDVAVSAGDVIGFCATGETGQGGVALVVGPAVGAAGRGLGVEKALLKRAAEGAAGRGAKSLRAGAKPTDPLRMSLLTGLGFARQPATGTAGEVVFTKAL